MKKLRIIALTVLVALSITAVAGAVTSNTKQTPNITTTKQLGKSRLVVGPQLQGGSVLETYTIQPTIAGNQLQGSSPQLQAPNTSAARLQPALGNGPEGYSLQ